MATRHSYAFLARNRHPEEDELPWYHLGGLVKMEFPRPLVLINGAFDLLHIGHMKVIFAAREKAGVEGTVVCAMDSDELVHGKGPGRPILSWIERATALGYMPIDALVEIGSDKEMRRLVQVLQPDLRVQGYDHANTPTRFPKIPRMFVRGTMHTSGIVQRILDKCKDA